MTDPRTILDLGMPLSAVTDAEDTAAIMLPILAQQAVLPRKLEEGVYAILDAEGAVRIVETDGYAQQRKHDWMMARAHVPERVKRAATVLDVDSFIDYLDRYTTSDSGVGEDYLLGDGSLEVWADLDARTIVGILDGIDARREHTATLRLKLSREWSEWAAIDGKLLDQVAFAEFIEDHISTIGEPAGAVLLDICQTLQAHTNVSFKQQAILATGQRQLRWEETVEAKAGQSGNLTIPGELTLVLRPFQGSEPVPVTARFRYQLRDGVLKIGIKLAEPDKALEDAFAGVVGDVQDSIPVRVNHGQG